MKKIYSILLALVMIFGASSAYANSGAYVSAKVGSSFTSMTDVSITGTSGTEDDNYITFGGGGALGYDFDNNFKVPVRAELEFLFFSDAAGTGNTYITQYLDIDYGVKTLMANVYYDFNTSTKFTPYITGGLG